jgi:hypothetical protein
MSALNSQMGARAGLGFTRVAQGRPTGRGKNVGP